MNIAFLNLCHCDPPLVARAARRLTQCDCFDMYIHVDAKQELDPFLDELKGNDRVYFVPRRHRVYWGGFNAVLATLELLEMALASPREYEYFCLMQNLDYPIKSNAYIEDYFMTRKGTEFIRACNISETKDWHFARKYRLHYQRDSDFYTRPHGRSALLLHKAGQAAKSLSTIGFDGIIKEGAERYPIYYGAAQWAVTRACARYILDFSRMHTRFHQVMKRVQFPDEEYFQTIVHNSPFRECCSRYDEPEQRWLVNWRNLHYFEYPGEITVFGEGDYPRLMPREELFIRKVRTEASSALLDRIDAAIGS